MDSQPKVLYSQKEQKFWPKSAEKKKVLCFVGENEQKRLKNGGNFFFKMTILIPFSTFVEKVNFIHIKTT